MCRCKRYERKIGENFSLSTVNGGGVLAPKGIYYDAEQFSLIVLRNKISCFLHKTRS